MEKSETPRTDLNTLRDVPTKRDWLSGISSREEPEELLYFGLCGEPRNDLRGCCASTV